MDNNEQLHDIHHLLHKNLEIENTNLLLIKIGILLISLLIYSDLIANKVAL